VPKFNHDQLLRFSERLLSSSDIPARDMQLVAKFLVKAQLRGYPGHGVTRVLQYLSWIRNGNINIHERPLIVREGKVTAVIEGNHYIGQVAAYEAIQLAIKKAKNHGMGMVCLRHAGHVGRLADYMKIAAEESLIGMAAAGVGSGNTTLYGGMEPVVGTNPMAFGIPVRNGNHILLDFATAAMSMSELQKRAARNEPIPAGVMLDGYGNPTSDFKTFRGPPRGALLPFGGYKGSGLSLLSEILGGILSENGLGSQWRDKGGAAVNGVFLQAISIEEFQPINHFLDQVDEFVSLIKSARAAPGHQEIFLPGERARQREAQQLKEGIEVDDATWTQLKGLAIELGVDLPGSM
jgi:hydroxycarboxylate dehydrogenase B